MNPVRLIRQECVIVHRSQTGPADEYGAPTWEESEADALIHVQPVDFTNLNSELVDRPAGRLTHTGYLLAATEISHADKVILATGQTWEVDGPPRIWFHPLTGEAVYQVVDLVGFTDQQESAS